MPVIPVSFDLLRSSYPSRPALTPELKAFMGRTPGTPCCVQVSHSLNMAGEVITQKYVGQRRNNSLIRVNGSDDYYLLAVDELETWLTLKYGPGENVGLDDAGRRRSPGQIKAYLQGRTGVLLFRNTGAGFHTELWDGTQIVQRDMNEHACFTQPRVLFWDSGAPQWLTDFMSDEGLI